MNTLDKNNLNFSNPSVQVTRLSHILFSAADCPFKYKLNPYSQTCVRFIKLERDWESAKTYCESHGEHLITFTTLDEIYWFINECKEDPGENETIPVRY